MKKIISSETNSIILAWNTSNQGLETIAMLWNSIEILFDDIILLVDCAKEGLQNHPRG